MVTKTKSLTLEPVIEVLASTFDPNLPPFTSMEDWSAWEGEVLERVGLGGLFRVGAWVRVRDLVALPDACETIVRATVQQHNGDPLSEDEPIDYVLACGIAIEVDGIDRAWPGCCADWGAIEELSKVLTTMPSGAQSIWIGHDGGALSITVLDPTTVRLCTRQDESVDETETWEMDQAVVLQGIAAANELIARFQAIAHPWISRPSEVV